MEINIETIKENIKSNNIFEYKCDGLTFKIDTHGLDILCFLLDIINNNPNVSIQEVRTLYNKRPNAYNTHYYEVRTIDDLVHRLTGKFGKGGGFWCDAYNNPQKENQYINTEEYVVEQTKFVTHFFSINVGIFTFSFSGGETIEYL